MSSVEKRKKGRSKKEPKTKKNKQKKRRMRRAYRGCGRRIDDGDRWRAACSTSLPARWLVASYLSYAAVRNSNDSRIGTTRTYMIPGRCSIGILPSVISLITASICM